MMAENKNSEYQEIIARLDALKDRAPLIPLIDPTANVKELVEMERRHASDIRLLAEKRQDDLRTQANEYQKQLREQAEKYQDKLSAERLRTEADAKRAESDRINALNMANKNDVALALEKQGAQTQAQDRRIAALEQNQYQGVGVKLQSTEGRQQNQWVIGIIVVVAIFLANFLGHVVAK